MKMKTYRHSLCLLSVLVALGGCSSLFGTGKIDEKASTASKEKRISVLQEARKIEVDEAAKAIRLEIPEEYANDSWPLAAGIANHETFNPYLRAKPEKMWSQSLPNGSDGDFKILARPVSAEGRVYAMDARGEVVATILGDGDKLWKAETAPENKSGDAMGGGLAYDNGMLFAATGFGEVVALKTTDGSVAWRKSIGKPLRAAPTAEDGRLFVVTIDNELVALAIPTGEILWRHNGITESASLMGASSPAVQGDNVVVAYSSGEIYNLRAQNGRVAWSESLASVAQVGAMPGIADIRGNPVIDGNVVYAISHSGRMAALDLRSGERLWEADVGGTNTPVVLRNAVVALTNENDLVALQKSTGKVIWMRQLQKNEKKGDKDSTRIFWSGPVLAGGMLWATNTMGQLASFSISDGSELSSESVAGPIFQAPIVARGTLFFVDDDGKLLAYR